MKGYELIQWIEGWDMHDSELAVCFLDDGVKTLSKITSICVNGETIQLNELGFDVSMTGHGYEWPDDWVDEEVA